MTTDTITKWLHLDLDQFIEFCERLGVVFDLSDNEITYTVPRGAKPELSYLINSRLKDIHKVLWCRSVNQPLWYWHTIHSPNYQIRGRCSK
jgi:hypothetical protein